MTKITYSRLWQLAPQALPTYKEALSVANYTLVAFGIMNNELRAAHFLAQIMHESGGLTRIIENLNYRAERLVEVWPTRFPTPAAAAPYAKNPEKLANFVYGNRMGNDQQGDGWKYIGRGMIQLTGKTNYQKSGASLSADFVSNPSLVLLPEYILIVAADFWRRAGCNTLADADDLVAITKAINGGTIGLADRRQWLARTKSAVFTSPGG